MMSPQERYVRDPEFHALVTMLESFICRAQFTPTELREAAVLAAIHYEQKTLRLRIFPDTMELHTLKGAP